MKFSDIMADCGECHGSRCEELEQKVENAKTHELRALRNNEQYRLTIGELRKALERIIPMLHQIGVNPTTRLLKIKAHITKALAERKE